MLRIQKTATHEPAEGSAHAEFHPELLDDLSRAPHLQNSSWDLHLHLVWLPLLVFELASVQEAHEGSLGQCLTALICSTHNSESIEKRTFLKQRLGLYINIQGRKEVLGAKRERMAEVKKQVLKEER